MIQSLVQVVSLILQQVVYRSRISITSYFFWCHCLPLLFGAQNRKIDLFGFGGICFLLKSDLSSIGCISLRTVVEKGDGSLDKEETSHDDLFDAFRMSLQSWH